MRIKFLLLSILLGSAFSGIFAHAIWIETKPEGRTGTEQQLKVFFGEYAEGERDSVSNWFSNLRDVKLELTAPDGEKKPLALTPASTFMQAAFTPGKAGIYTVSIAHTVKDVYGTSKIEYYALATVKIDGAEQGKNLTGNAASLAFAASNDKLHTGKPLPLKTFYKQNPLAEGKVSIAAPSGWSKSFTADKYGELNFVPAWPGLYLAEAFYTDETPGTHFGKEYKSTMHIVTYGIYVD